jgi:hypothetical protein
MVAIKQKSRTFTFPQPFRPLLIVTKTLAVSHNMQQTTSDLNTSQSNKHMITTKYTTETLQVTHKSGKESIEILICET